MNVPTYRIYLDRHERCCCYNTFVSLKNILLRQGKYTNYVDELMHRAADAPTKKMKIKYVQSAPP